MNEGGDSHGATATALLSRGGARQHITNSAKKLHGSAGIHRLEQELGVKLLERAGRGVRLTACGRALDKRIRPVLAALDSIPTNSPEVSGRENATVRLSILSASGLVVDAIAAWRSQHPRFVITPRSSGHWDIRLSTEDESTAWIDLLARGAAAPVPRAHWNSSSHRAGGTRAHRPSRSGRRSFHLPGGQPGVRESIDRLCTARFPPPAWRSKATARKWSGT